jgi:hypothetical protein
MGYDPAKYTWSYTLISHNRSDLPYTARSQYGRCERDVHRADVAVGLALLALVMSLGGSVGQTVSMAL